MRVCRAYGPLGLERGPAAQRPREKAGVKMCTDQPKAVLAISYLSCLSHLLEPLTLLEQLTLLEPLFVFEPLT